MGPYVKSCYHKTSPHRCLYRYDEASPPGLTSSNLDRNKNKTDSTGLNLFWACSCMFHFLKFFLLKLIDSDKHPKSDLRVIPIRIKLEFFKSRHQIFYHSKLLAFAIPHSIIFSQLVSKDHYFYYPPR